MRARDGEMVALFKVWEQEWWGAAKAGKGALPLSRITLAKRELPSGALVKWEHCYREHPQVADIPGLWSTA